MNQCWSEKICWRIWCFMILQPSSVKSFWKFLVTWVMYWFESHISSSNTSLIPPKHDFANQVWASKLTSERLIFKYRIFCSYRSRSSVDHSLHARKKILSIRFFLCTISICVRFDLKTGTWTSSGGFGLASWWYTCGASACGGWSTETPLNSPKSFLTWINSFSRCRIRAVRSSFETYRVFCNYYI